VQDLLGSVRAVVAESGEVLEARDYYAWGLQMPGRQYDATGGSGSASEDYTGHELDEVTGLHYAGARYYDAALGRFNKPDRFEHRYPMYSSYVYSLNNPVKFFDTSGDTVIVSRDAQIREAVDIWKSTSRGAIDYEALNSSESTIVIARKDNLISNGKKANGVAIPKFIRDNGGAAVVVILIDVPGAMGDGRPTRMRLEPMEKVAVTIGHEAGHATEQIIDAEMASLNAGHGKGRAATDAEKEIGLELNELDKK
jgi:RHS repeat-associated protein